MGGTPDVPHRGTRWARSPSLSLLPDTGKKAGQTTALLPLSREPMGSGGTVRGTGRGTLAS